MRLAHPTCQQLLPQCSHPVLERTLALFQLSSGNPSDNDSRKAPTHIQGPLRPTFKERSDPHSRTTPIHIQGPLRTTFKDHSEPHSRTTPNHIQGPLRTTFKDPSNPHSRTTPNHIQGPFRTTFKDRSEPHSRTTSHHRVAGVSPYFLHENLVSRPPLRAPARTKKLRALFFIFRGPQTAKQHKQRQKPKGKALRFTPG